MSATKHFEVTLKRSLAGRSESVRKTLVGLGLKRFGKTVYLRDTPTNRGMLYKVVHMIQVVPKEGELPAAR